MENLKLGMFAYHKKIYDGKELMKIVGIRETEVELEGDYSGGTHNVCQRDWLPIDGLILANKEIERKWLLPGEMVDEVLEHQFVLIEQGYIDSVRFRKVVNPITEQINYYQTIKISNGSLLSSDEYEVELTREQFSEFWPATNGKRIEKKRYFMGNHVVVDFIKVEYGYLKLIEKEFKSIEDANQFQPSNFFGKEVTHDVKYKNIYIAEYGFEY